MKKVICFVLCLTLLCACLCGCGKKEEAVKIDLEKAKENVAALKLDGEALMSSLSEYPEEELKLAYGIDVSMIDEYTFMYPLVNVQASMFAVIKPSEGNFDAVRSQVDTFLERYAESWSMYLPEQSALVKNAEVVEYEGYIIVAISYDNEAVINAVKDAAK